LAFRLVEQYLPGTAKGACYLCASSRRTIHDANGPRDEHVLDTGLVIDFEGGLAICETCFREGAQLLGLVDVAERDAAANYAMEAAARVAEAECERDEAIALAETVVAFREKREAAERLARAEPEPAADASPATSEPTGPTAKEPKAKAARAPKAAA
jgi:hypothetical protein